MHLKEKIIWYLCHNINNCKPRQNDRIQTIITYLFFETSTSCLLCGNVTYRFLKCPIIIIKIKPLWLMRAAKS